MTYIIPHEGCRLGNWLFYYAAAVSNGDGKIAVVDNGVDTRRFLERYQKSFFKDAILVPELPSNVEVWEEVLSQFTPCPKICMGRSLALHGFFQSLVYFDFEKTIPRLRMSSDEKEAYHSQYHEWLDRPNVTAIHVRRGDYLCQQHRFPFVGKWYFRRAIERLGAAKDFMIFSDDILWCKAFFPKTFPNCNFYFVESGDLIDDFRLQSLCKHNIISNSSYSWWAAHLNENAGHRILAPSVWSGFEPRSRGSDGARMLYHDAMEIVPTGFSFSQWCIAHWQCLRQLILPRMRERLFHRIRGDR